MAITINDDLIGGELLGAHLVPVRAYPPQRVCAHMGCRTILSVYNGRSRCAEHDFCVSRAQGCSLSDGEGPC